MNPGRRSKTKHSKARYSNLKTVEVGRGRNGYGFTMAGQYPCVLSSILSGSPADVAGLKSGDCVMAVNGESVARVGHAQIIKLIGSTSGVLRLTVAGLDESESSDEDYVPAPRMRYHRSKSITPTVSNRGEMDVMERAEINQEPFYEQKNPMYSNGDAHSQLKTPTGMDAANKFAPGHLSPYNRTGKAPVMLQKPTSGYDYTYWNGKGFEHLGGPQKPRRVKRYSESKQFRQRAYSAQSHAMFYGEEDDDEDQGLRPLTPVEVSNIMYPSHRSNSRLGSRHARPAVPVKEQQVLMHAIVGYLGSIDIPASANLPTASLQAIRGCVRRLHLEQRVHSLMLMEITNTGVELINANHIVTVVYPAGRITFSGVCPDDKRCFGIVTSQNHDEIIDCVDSDDEPIGSSCHVFIVDPSLSFHNVHYQMADRFGIQCLHDPATNTCQQFPSSSRPLLTHISMLHRDHGDSLQFADFYGQSLHQAGPRRSNSNSSNSDSGFGNGKENGTEINQHGERVMIVDVAGHIRNQRSRVHPESSPNRHVVHAEINTSQSSFSLSSASPSSPEHSPQSTFNPGKLHDPSGRLTPRARPDPIMRDASGSVTPLARQSMAAMNTSSGRLTPRARPDPVGFSSPLGMPMLPHQKNDKQHQQGLNMVRPHYRPPGESTASPNLHVKPSDVQNVQLRNRQTGPANVKGRPPTGRHSMYAKTDANQRNQDLMNPTKKDVKPKVSQIQRLTVSKQHDLTRRNSDCSEYSSSNMQTSIQRARRTYQIHLQEPVTGEPLAASDGELDANVESVSQKSDGNHSNPNLLDIPNGQDRQEIGRVSSWAVSFDRLLQDELGLACFTEFLKREFSEENIMFWIACETMSKMTKQAELARMAEHIYTKHLSDDASMPVNLDSSCRIKVLQALKSPSPEMFKVQQQQIFKLMKFDSYSRFLKSKVYQDCMLAEIAGNPLPISFSRQRSDGSVSSVEDTSTEGKKSAQKGNKKKYQIWKTAKSYGLEVPEESPDKKRKSLLPWNRAKVTKKPSKEQDAVRETAFSKLAANDASGRRGLSLSRTKSTPDGTTQAVTPEGICRLIFPNEDVVVLPARQGFTVREILVPHLDVRQLHLQTVETFLADSKEIVDYDRDIGTMSGATIVVEQRVVFKMELPSHRVIGVKSKPNKKLIEVLRPVTHKYNLQLDALVVHLSNSPVPLDLDITVATLDCQKILIETIEQYGAGNYQATASVEPANTGRSSTQSTLHKSASEESFIRKRDSQQTHVVQLQRRYSDAGSNTKDTTDGSGDKPASDSQPVVLRPSNSDTSVQQIKANNRKLKIKNSDAEELYTMLSKAQRRRMDDQRGLTIKNLDLPDFLKKSENESSDHRPKSALGNPYHYNRSELLLQSYEKSQRFKEMAVRCKSTPPTPYNEDMGFREGIIPSLDQAEAVFGARGRTSDITPVNFNESMTAFTGGLQEDGEEINFDMTLFGLHSDANFSTNLRSEDKFSPRAFPTSHRIPMPGDSGARERGYSLEIYDPTQGVMGDVQGLGIEGCRYEQDLDDDLDQTITKSSSRNEAYLPPAPYDLDNTLRLEEANYSPPPPLVPQSLTSADDNQLELSATQEDDTIQGSTLPGHATDFSNQPLTDTDSVTFGDNPVSDDLSPRTPSPSTHDIVLTPNQDEDFDEGSILAPLGPVFNFQQSDLTHTNTDIKSSAGPDVLNSLYGLESSGSLKYDTSQQGASQPNTSTYAPSLQSTFHPAMSYHSTFQQESSHKYSPRDGTSQQTFSQPSTFSTFQQGTSQKYSSKDDTSYHTFFQPSTTHHSAPEYSSTSQPSTSKPSASQSGTSQLGASQTSTSQLGTSQPSTSQLGASQPDTYQPSASQSGTSQPGTFQLGTSQLGTFQLSTSQPGTSQPSASQSGTSQPNSSSSSNIIPKQGTNLQWKATALQQQKIDHSKWETVVKDGRSMRATFV